MLYGLHILIICNHKEDHRYLIQSTPSPIATINYIYTDQSLHIHGDEVRKYYDEIYAITYPLMKIIKNYTPAHMDYILDHLAPTGKFILPVIITAHTRNLLQTQVNTAKFRYRLVPHFTLQFVKKYTKPIADVVIFTRV
jgi:hypothetical protein